MTLDNTMPRMALRNLVRACAVTIILAATSVLGACSTISEKPGACSVSDSYNLDTAFTEVEDALMQNRRQCAPHFDNYWKHLLATAEGNPDGKNKRRFSEFLLKVSDEGIISQRQAQDLYNRYFNIKFVSLVSDYNICSQACPVRASMMANMERELSDKQQGLLKISSDRQSFQRANRLLQESELLLEATCSSCSAGS